MNASATPFYITTAIDYVNGAPHLGHAYEKMATDAVARAYRLMKVPTYFLTGTDEHGLKVEENAVKNNKSPKAFVDELSQEFTRLWDHCNIDYDRFIRTTEKQHYALVTEMWDRMLQKGDIYKASYEGKYCSGCEAFLNERDMDQFGQCLIHKRAPDPVLEENYFFKLSAYTDKIKAHFAENPDFVQPEFRKNEVLNMLDELHDISVSRSRKSVTWGIPVPNDDEQVIYVWIDALSNYLTGINCFEADDSLYQTYWKTPEGAPNAVHVIGKDILRFHAIYWPAMLMSAELPLPKTIFAHGFITLNDAKISKSLGNVMSPFDLTKEFDLQESDIIRYYLLTCTPFGNDGNFTLDEFKNKVNADIANNLGNLLNRSLSMVKKYYDGVLPVYPVDMSDPVFDALRETKTLRENVEKAYTSFNFQAVSALLLERVDLANRSINDLEPWTLKKNGEDAKLAALMVSLLESIRIVAILFQPLLPTLSLNILAQLGFGQLADYQLTFDTVESHGFSKETPHVTAPTGPIMPRLDDELAGKEKKKG